MGGRRIDAGQDVRGVDGRDGPVTLLRGIRYKPLPTQRLFHLSDARFKGYSGPVGSGKSQDRKSVV